MRCEEVKKKRLEFLDNLLAEAVRAAVDEHLLSCAHCRQEVSELRASWKVLDDFPGLSPSGDFVERTMASFREMRKKERKALALRRGVIAAAAGVLLVLSVVFFNSLGEGDLQHSPALADEEVIENLDLVEDLEFLEEFADDLDMVMEYEFYVALSDEEAL